MNLHSAPAQPLLAFDFSYQTVGGLSLVHADDFDRLRLAHDCSSDAVVTASPHDTSEYEIKEIETMHIGIAGV